MHNSKELSENVAEEVTGWKYIPRIKDVAKSLPTKALRIDDRKKLSQDDLDLVRWLGESGQDF